ncbi:MAG: DUF5658 family protein [Coriobacteriia bacterium]|nr:DUF5658 family protein [Coriobacteriia bacterium]
MSTCERIGDRRASRAAFRFPERRTGFDRRRPNDPLRTLADNPAALVALLVALNALSAADWALTSRALANGAQEANAVMAALINANPVAAGGFKAAMMLAITLLVWRSRRYRLVLAAAAGAFAVYGILMIYHAAGLVSLGAL